MNIKVSKKAKSIIEDFSTKEETTYKYLLECYKVTIQKIEGCIKEVEVFENKDPKYKYTIQHQHEAEFRLKYIFQCLNLKANYDYENKTLSIKSDLYEDKDN